MHTERQRSEGCTKELELKVGLGIRGCQADSMNGTRKSMSQCREVRQASTVGRPEYDRKKSLQSMETQQNAELEGQGGTKCRGMTAPDKGSFIHRYQGRGGRAGKTFMQVDVGIPKRAVLWKPYFDGG